MDIVLRFNFFEGFCWLLAELCCTAELCPQLEHQAVHCAVACPLPNFGRGFRSRMSRIMIHKSLFFLVAAITVTKTVASVGLHSVLRGRHVRKIKR